MNEDAAKIFADDWYELGDEKSDTQKFWLTLLRDVFDVAKPEKFIDFEVAVHGGFIDAYISQTKTLIEQKSFGIDLTKKFLQSDGKLLTPHEQAQRYAKSLNEPPRWIVTCNFSEFRIYKPDRDEPTVIKLRDLRYQYRRLRFLIDSAADDSPPEEKISKEALEVISKIYDAFAKNYRKNKVADFEDALNKICTRLVFCLYAGDAQLFDANQFFNYLQSFDDAERNVALQNLFEVLNTPPDARAGFDDALKNFPYVNGGLFDEKIALPAFNKNVGNPITGIGVFNARKKFSWHEISPPVFGAMFESTFSKENRQRVGGMYYTGVDNIHKVIDPLFMEDLRDEFEIIKRKQIKNRATALLNLQDKIASLTFLDPACGSGNFLTETYLSLRRLENEILEELRPLINLPDNPIKVSINQFFGIEINSFAVAVAQTALWIAENQMLQQTEGALGKNLQALPLKSYATIVCGNALKMDWTKFFEMERFIDGKVESKSSSTFNLATSSSCNLYIIGNPPFVGKSFQTREQKSDMAEIFAGVEGYGNLDYVACWFKKAADFIHGTKTSCAFVATNSISQGIAVPPLWTYLFGKGIKINFAHQTFQWLSDSENMAHVHCVVVGFANFDAPVKKIFDGKNCRVVDFINAYLVDGPNIIVEPRDNPLRDDVPLMIVGSCPTDGGGFIIEANELDEFLSAEPAAEKYIRLYLGSAEFIKGKKRYCLWLKDCPLEDIKKMPLVNERVDAVRDFRLASKKPQTRRRAETPTLFAEDRFVDAPAIIIPMLSSCNRRYVPIGFVDAGVVINIQASFIPNGDLYTFGVLTSSIMMAWLKTVGGQFKSDYRFSPTIVYNTFPFCEVTARQRRLIERSAQNILTVRADFPDWTLAKLYNEDTMPDELRSAHKWNDYNVALAYGFENFWTDEAKVVAELMKLYKALTNA